MNESDIGMIGLGVMGKNLAHNLRFHNFHVSIFDIRDGVTDSIAIEAGKDNPFISCHSCTELVSSLKKPRIVFLMVNAGPAVDEILDQLLHLLESGDIVIDGGNSNFADTQRRYETCVSNGIYYVGAGVSGGAEGALNGPCIMPGGSIEAWEYIKPILTTICAKTDSGEPCCAWIGKGGAGHYVKMVHNGIEYGDMQLICEAYDFMHSLLDMNNDEMSRIFCDWNSGELQSYLIEITGRILKHRDESGDYTVDLILDTAGQKGTGKWASISALNSGVPLTLISEAVYARYLSSMIDERLIASEHYNKAIISIGLSDQDLRLLVHDIKLALLGAKIISYAQGFDLMRTASAEYGWDLDCASIASIWRGGCIIRSAFLDNISNAFRHDPSLKNLLLDRYFTDTISGCIDSLRKVTATAILHGLPVPSMSSAISYFDSYTSRHLPANLLQAQRDYFGSHTYERIDSERGSFYHTEWT